MKIANGKGFWGMAALGAGMLLMGSASAWYGDPWYRPYGSGAVTYERQNMMRAHGYNMDRLAEMLEGQQIFNREEAVRLARELEAGFGDSLIRNFAPGTVVAGSRTAPWTWRDFGAFAGYARAAEQSSAALAKALEKEPQSTETRPAAGPVPPWGRGSARGPWGRPLAVPLSMEAFQAYSRLYATCQSCHIGFRGWRR
jgi:cytochrome c556